MALYCVDTSSIVAAWVEHYPPDVFVSLWNKLDELIDNGDLIAPEEVRQELRHPAELKDWARDRPDMFWELDSVAHQQSVREVVDRLREELRGRELLLRPTDFKADPFVVALARIESAVVVCNEKRQREANGRPKLPNLCEWYQVRSVNLVEFLREIGWRF